MESCIEVRYVVEPDSLSYAVLGLTWYLSRCGGQKWNICGGFGRLVIGTGLVESGVTGG